jgi:hypothetical protein
VIVDFDDFAEDDNRLDLLHLLHDANPDFRCTLFAIPGRGSAEFWKLVPEWCELAVHGFEHPHPRECAEWTRFQIETVLYEVLNERGWWIAEHWDNVDRLPDDLRAHIIQPSYREGTWHWHGHIPNVCGNGIAETFDELLERVQAADSFQLISEVVQ